MQNKSQTSIIVTFFLVLSVLFAAVVAQNVNESVNATVLFDEPNESLFNETFLNETTFFNETLLNESLLLNESNETTPLNETPLNESNETILNETDENLTIPEQTDLIEPALNETPEEPINESIPVILPELNETNESVDLEELNVTGINQTFSINDSQNSSNLTREVELNESVNLTSQTRPMYRLKAGKSNRINVSGLETTDITVVLVNTRNDYAVLQADGREFVINTGENITIRGRNFHIKDIAFVEFRRVPEPEVWLE